MEWESSVERPAFDPDMFRASLSHLTADAIAAWRVAMQVEPQQRTEKDLDAIDILASCCTFFGALEPAQRRELCRVAARQQAGSGEHLCRAGEGGNDFYVVILGTVDVVLSLDSAMADLRVLKALSLTKGMHPQLEHVVAKLGPLDSYGEKLLEDADPSRQAAALRATSACEVMRIQRAQYVAAMRSWRRQHIPEKIKFLKRTSLFQAWPDDEIQRVAHLLHMRAYRPGDAIIHQGARREGVDVYFIRLGECFVQRTLPDTGSLPTCVNLALLHKYDCFGGQQFLSEDEPIRESVVAATNVEVFCIKRDAFAELVRKNPSLLVSIREKQEDNSITDEDLRSHLAKRRKWDKYKLHVLQQVLPARKLPLLQPLPKALKDERPWRPATGHHRSVSPPRVRPQTRSLPAPMTRRASMAMLQTRYPVPGARVMLAPLSSASARPSTEFDAIPELKRLSSRRMAWTTLAESS